MDENRVEQLIAGGHIQAKLIVPGCPVPTVVDAAQALHVPPSSILKSLLFVSAHDDLILAIAAGMGRIKTALLERAVSEPGLRLANRRVVLERTGFPVGAMPPVGHDLSELTVVIDEPVMGLDLVYGGGGTVDTLLEITPDEILRVTGASIAAICEAEAS